MMKVALFFIPVSSPKVLGFPWEQDFSLFTPFLIPSLLRQ